MCIFLFPKLFLLKQTVSNIYLLNIDSWFRCRYMLVYNFTFFENVDLFKIGWAYCQFLKKPIDFF